MISPMRWRFPDPDDLSENMQRAAIVARIDTWWRNFTTKVEDVDALFHRRAQWDLTGWMRSELAEIDDRLMWEFGPGTKGGHRLVITPELNLHLRPLTRAILARAPRLEGWEFYEHRLAEDLDTARATVAARTGGDLDALSVVPVLHRRRIDLTFSTSRNSGEEQAAIYEGFVACEALLGEDILDRWVGELQASRKRGGLRLVSPARDDGTIELGSLKAYVDDAIAEWRRKLPARAWADMGEEEWSLYRLQPPEVDDYARWDDLFIASTCFPDLFKELFEDERFYSDTLSNFGEMFCVVKVERSDDFDMDERTRLEEELDEHLKHRSLGAVIGNGTGVRYSYVFLALKSPDEALQVVSRIAHKCELPRRSWILFLDSELEEEWLPVWPGGEKPPEDSQVA
jgi:hypothetical protein